MNPKYTKFIEDNPNMSLIGFTWACYWRLTLVIMGVYIGVIALIFLLAALSN